MCFLSVINRHSRSANARLECRKGATNPGSGLHERDRAHFHRRPGPSAFTLVELLVVIAIIGILVALLLPAVNSAREAARRTQCMNQIRSMGQAILNLESAVGTFPSGGIEPWPQIESYSSNGQPFGPDKQGLSWAFQILPYLEENAVHGLATTAQITNSPIALYFCPSRRPPTFFQDGGVRYWLMDYASLEPIPSRAQLGSTAFDNQLRIDANDVNRGCRTAFAFWGTRTYTNDFAPRTRMSLGIFYTGFNGAIVRSSHLVGRDGRAIELGYDKIVTVRRVKDGLSKTSLVAEKRIRLGEQPGAAYDDRGWSDGWDLDTVSSAICPPIPDSRPRQVSYVDAISAGSAHTGGLNVVFCDDSTRFIAYGVDLELWNNLAHRSDGQVAELP